ncbi:MAG: hypothetical protein ACTHKU_00620 [Verrucomicrobiota bacterium]
MDSKKSNPPQALIFGRSAVGWGGVVARRLGWTALCLASVVAHGQEALRMSMAGQAAAEAEAQKTRDNPHYYNVALGPASLRFQSTMGFEFNDNVQYSHTDRQSDVVLRPTLNMRAFWPVTDNNALFFSSGVGYAKYLQTSSLDRLVITPDSNLAFRMYVGDFVIHFHDRFSLSQDIQQNPTVSGTGNFYQLENTAGVNVDWDLNEMIVSFGYDHDLVSYPDSSFSYSDHHADLLNAQVGVKLNSAHQVGLQLGGGMVYYDQRLLNDNTHFSVGPFYQAQLTDHIQARAFFGYAWYWFSGSTNSLPPQNGGYATISLTHRVNRWLDQSLSGGRQFSSSVGTELLDLYYANWQAEWRFIRGASLTSGFSYQHGSRQGASAETFNQYGANIAIGHQFARKWSGSIGYHYWLKQSDVAVGGYFQNVLVLNVARSF